MFIKDPPTYTAQWLKYLAQEIKKKRGGKGRYALYIIKLICF